MANAVVRFFNRNLFKIKEITSSSKPKTCTRIMILNINRNNNTQFATRQCNVKPLYCIANGPVRLYSHKPEKEPDEEPDEEPKLTLLQKFKHMYKNYWYVLVPVHLVTSTIWFGGFYYMAKSGVDIATLLESWHFSEKITSSLRDSNMGYLAVAYALYKISTPARYTVTLGGTTISINYLKKWGYIKPVPSKERLKEIYLEQKDNLLETMRDTRHGLKVHSGKIKDKKENIIDDLDESIEQIKKIGDTIKSKDHIIEEVKKKTNKDVKD